VNDYTSLILVLCGNCYVSILKLHVRDSTELNKAMEGAFIRALLLVAEERMGKDLSDTRKKLKCTALAFSEDVAQIIKEAEDVLFDSAPTTIEAGQMDSEDSSLDGTSTRPSCSPRRCGFRWVSSPPL
jgi:hypothetical protein